MTTDLVTVGTLRSGDRLMTGRGIGVVTSLMRGSDATSLMVKTNEGPINVTLYNNDEVTKVTSS
jgi:hypothetical protein